jgi:hypothetical protein
MNEQFLLTCKDAAEVCGCSERTWRSWDAMGLMPMPVYIGKSRFWRRRELIAWTDAGCPNREDWDYSEVCENSA